MSLYEEELGALKGMARIKDFLSILIRKRIRDVLKGRVAASRWKSD